MVITSIFLITSHWNSESDRVFSGIVAICLIVGFNLSLLLIKEIPTPWGTIQTRTDAIDAFRWCVNFPLDIYIVWNIEADLSSAVIIWLLLTFGAMTEVYGRRHKLISVGAAVISFCVLIYIYDADLKTQTYLIACYLSLVFILWKLQQYVSDEMLQAVQAQIERQNMEREAETLQRNAAIGHSTRAINHELNTLIGIANLSLFQIESKNQTDSLDNEIERLNKSLSYMTRVSSLILDGLGNRNAAERTISLAELHSDLKLLLCINTDFYLNQLKLEFPDDASDYQFLERTGSTYLIIHNLVKNAHEAVTEKYGRHPDGLIRIKATVENNILHLSVSDNGTGMSTQEISDVQNQIGVTKKLEGHGLGLKFVKSECDKNGMKLLINSVPNDYSLFTIQIALISQGLLAK